MAVDLAEDQFIASLKREVTPLGSTLFSNVTDNAVWLGYLTDAFWEAKLDGFMENYVEEDGEVSHVSGGADLDRKYVALIVLYAGIRVLRNRILNMDTGFKAKAGPVEFEQQKSATMLAEMLKQLRATKDRVLTELDQAEETYALVLDALSVRTFSSASYWGSPELTG